MRERRVGDHFVTIPRTEMQASQLSWSIHQFLARRSDTTAVLVLRRWTERVLALLRSENHDARTNGEYRLVDELAPRLRVVIDVGANRGEWTARVVERAPEAVVYCFELARPTRERLSLRFRDEPRVKVQPCGLADSEAEIDIKYYPGDDRLTSIYDYPHPQKMVVRTERVERGDDVMERAGVEHIDLLKIDAEGADLAVLRGFERTMARAGISVIQFEYGFACVLSRSFLLDFYELLAGYGFCVGRLRSTYVDFEPYRLESETFFGPNFVAVHRSAPTLIQQLASRKRRRRQDEALMR